MTEAEIKIQNAPRRSSLLWGAISQWFSVCVIVLIGLIVQPIYVHRLGTESYGLWGLVASFIGFYGLFDLGLGAAVSRFLGTALGSRDTKKLNEVASTGKCLLFAASVLIVIIALSIMKLAQVLLRIPEIYTFDFRVLLLLSATSIAISLTMSVYSGALLASEDFVMLSIIRIFSNAIRSLGGLTLVLLGKGVIGLAIASVAAAVFEQSVIYLRCRKRLPELKPAFAGFKLQMAHSLFGFGSMRLVASVAEVVRSRFDIMLVARFAGLGQTGLYNIALTAFRYFFTAASSAAGVTWPRLNILYGSGNKQELGAFFIRSSRVITVITSVIVGLLIGLAPVLIRVWMGPGHEDSATILRILVAGYFIDLATNPGIGGLYATAKHKYFAVQSVIESILSFCLALFLGSRYGMIGVALGIVIPITVIKLTIQPWYVSRTLSVNFFKYWFYTIGLSAIITGILAWSLTPVEYCFLKWGWWTMPPMVIASLFVPGIILWFCVLEKTSRSQIVALVKKNAQKAGWFKVKTEAVSVSQ